MKYAVIGKGKTGGQVIKELQRKKLKFEVFDSKRNPTVQELSKFDVGILFVNSEVFKEISPILLESKTPLIIGTTGIEWSLELQQKVKDNQCKWIKASNFSKGMALIQQMISNVLSKAPLLFSEYSFSIKETHHTKKVDSPSGTALSWKKWLNEDCSIASTREGDIIGYHEITLKGPTEEITISHTATDRSIFATGAIHACSFLKSIDFGLHEFEYLAAQQLTNKLTEEH